MTKTDKVAHVLLNATMIAIALAGLLMAMVLGQGAGL